MSLEETGRSVRSADRACTRTLFANKARCNSADMKWSNIAENVAILLVVYADRVLSSA